MLLKLPSELLFNVVDFVDDANDLRNLARVCKRCQAASEPKLYELIFLRTPAQLRGLLASLRGQPAREEAIKSVDARFQSFNDDNAFDLLGQLLGQTPKLGKLIIESPYCHGRGRFISERGPADWSDTIDSWLAPLISSTLLSNVSHAMLIEQPLFTLTKLTLHLSGTERDYCVFRGWYGAIFAHSTLQDLQISNVILPDEVCSNVRSTKTPLKNLTLAEVSITSKALHDILSFPRALESFELVENQYSFEEQEQPYEDQQYCALTVRDLGQFIKSLQQQCASLQTLCYVSQAQELPGPVKTAVGLGNFVSLNRLILNDHPHVIDAIFLRGFPIPPKLAYIKLYGLRDDLFFKDEYLWADSPRPSELNIITALAATISSLSELNVMLRTDDEWYSGDDSEWEETKQVMRATGELLVQRGCSFALIWSREGGQHCPKLFDEPSPLETVTFRHSPSKGVEFDFLSDGPSSAYETDGTSGGEYEQFGWSSAEEDYDDDFEDNDDLD
ncbi:hypothetical protein K470DRAFT_271437 [Piedraia hortae CBS 480.64]|uniref:F-box domain-containing protein n=1 Tax=Piedraia hortae CBS 480.64 TaxID=1314780 RepID=A0A6A7BYE6_9PEZI|nr:hypothetical protein K470DRAFT_271437 [Piedraia hortae CBS 480.64]